MPDLKSGSLDVELQALIQFIEAIKALVPECRIHITRETISAIAVDFGNVALVIATISKVGAATLKGDTTVVLGLDTSGISKALSPLTRIELPTETILHLSWEPTENTPLLTLEMESLGFSARFKTVNLATIRKDPNPPKIFPNTEFTCDADRFMSGIRSCAAIDDSCHIETNQTQEVFTAAKNETEQCKFRIASGSRGAPSTASYSLDYLKDIAKVFDGADAIQVKFDTDFPISLTTDLYGGLNVKYLLAPRVNEDEHGGWKWL